jgi:hypothetical protein
MRPHPLPKLNFAVPKVTWGRQHTYVPLAVTDTGTHLATAIFTVLLVGIYKYFRLTGIVALVGGGGRNMRFTYTVIDIGL